ISASDDINANKNISFTTSPSKADQIETKTVAFNQMQQNKVSLSVQGVSIYRSTLLNIESLLHRQLREKAKLDNLESIKMHILMRLNLKKLPNITKPILVPQNILDNFYKDYNVSAAKNMLKAKEEYVDVSKPTINDNGKSEEITDENSSSQMQGDDANTVNKFRKYFDHNQDYSSTDNEEEEYVNILSHISSIYIFPEQFQPHARNNRNRNKPKADFLKFKIDNSYTDLSYATLHLYLRGWEWISTHQPELIDEIEKQESKDIVVTIHRAVRRSNNSSITHKAKILEFRQRIPLGLGEWVNVDLLNSLFSVDRGGNKTQEIIIKGAEFWMKPLVVTTDNTASKNPLTVHIEIGSQKKHRRKRSVFMDCTENDHDLRCCRYPLKVNFTSFGWHFVVAPTSFDAFFCSGDCKVGYLEQYPHTHLAALTTSATPCCSPTKMSSLSLLYFDDNHNLVLSVIPNMSVEGCSCS
ncbi:hypothetical protein KR032_006878, partial [Drosophila birchii]